MNEYRPNISQLFNAAFGLIPLTYRIDDKTQDSAALNYGSIETKPIAQAKKMSWMGTPIIFPMTFEGGTYDCYEPNGTVGNRTLSNFDLPPATIVDFRRAKNITKTNVLGSGGSVKEIYGFDDWNIRIRGLCLDTPQSSAYEQHQELLKWEELADAIKVIGQLFIDKSIYAIAIEDMDFRQLEGRQSVIPFEITACSDIPLELYL